MYQIRRGYVVALVIVCAVHIASVSGDNDGCNVKQVCLPASQCPTILDVVYRCGDDTDDFKVCCPKDVLNQTTTAKPVTSNPLENRIKQMFPDVCGEIDSTDRIIAGSNAFAGQFPWMALLGYKYPEVKEILFYCGGSIINTRYVLTAAHCMKMDPLTLSLVRLGELDQATPLDDCNENKVCADPYVEIAVERAIPHPQWNQSFFKNDIGLIRLKQKITYTEYIRPICLPFASNYKKTPDTGKRHTVSGWGTTRSSDVGGSAKLLYTYVYIWDINKCEARASPDTKPLNPSSQICANGNKTQDACKGDSGGPLMDEVDNRPDRIGVQIGIVSFAMGRTCGSVELPTVYTRVSHFTKWILDTVRP